MLSHAYSGQYAVAAMNVSNMETAAAVLAAADKLDRPVMLQVSPLQMQVQGFSYRRIVRLIEAVASDYSHGSYSIHLDHAERFEDCQEALEAGFNSVMLDGGSLPYEQNISEVSRVRGITDNALEGELGVVGGGEAASTDIAMRYTDPAAAADFVACTGVNWLAVAIGNAHGMYYQTPKLNFDILRQIREKTSVPLVLHGASGIPHDELTKAVSMGVAKINFFTELDIAFKSGWADGAAEGGYMMMIAHKAQGRMQAKAEELIAICSGTL